MPTNCKKWIHFHKFTTRLNREEIGNLKRILPCKEFYSVIKNLLEKKKLRLGSFTGEMP